MSKFYSSKNDEKSKRNNNNGKFNSAIDTSKFSEQKMRYFKDWCQGLKPSEQRANLKYYDLMLSLVKVWVTDRGVYTEEAV